MTILNLAIGAEDIAIVTDSRQSASLASGESHAFEQLATKCIAFPLQALLVAHSGFGGISGVVNGLHEMLRSGVLCGDVLALSEAVPEQLRAIASGQKFTGAGRVVLAGISGGRAHAFMLDAPSWRAQAFEQGAWCQPGLRATERTGSPPSGDKSVLERLPVADLTPPDAPPDFRDSLYTICHIADRQHAENPVTCGGPLVLSTICTGMVIRQHVLRTLGEP